MKSSFEVMGKFAVSRQQQLFLVGASGVLPVIAASTLLRSGYMVLSISLAACVAVAGYNITVYLVPKLEGRLQKAGLFGKDINKRGTDAGERPVPESLGLAPGVVSLGCLAIIQLFQTTGVVPWACTRMGLPDCVLPDQDTWLDDFPAALASIAFMLMLGFVDDVLDLPWRVKLVTPLIGSLPLLAAYSGATAVGIPMPIVNYFNLKDTYIELGPLYYIYMVGLVIFCTNAINILAGVNGLEVGQSYVIGVAILTFNILRMAWYPGAILLPHNVRECVNEQSPWCWTPCRSTCSCCLSVSVLTFSPMCLISCVHAGSTLSSSALFSSYVMLPMTSTSLGLLVFNWYPSRVFVGDTYTYFAGMSIAVAGILGHFSETLLIFLVPQLFNFVYSIPQLFGLVHCPRHRLPKFDPATGMLTPTPNWNVVNLALQIGGSCSELWLCIRILFVQVVCCAAGLACNMLLRGVWKR